MTIVSLRIMQPTTFRPLSRQNRPFFINQTNPGKSHHLFGTGFKTIDQYGQAINHKKIIGVQNGDIFASTEAQTTINGSGSTLVFLNDKLQTRVLT